MRALAVVAVMIFHANHAWLPAGFLGVEVFFVISGYLITLLLIGEHERTGLVNLGAFWARRARRLLPALTLTLMGVMAYCALFMRDALGKLRGDVVAAVFYVSNWYQIWTGQGYSALVDFVPLRHLWSLAVEEQFYLFWPLIMILILRRGREHLPRVGVWLIGISVLIGLAVGVFFHGDFYNTNAAEFPSAYVEIFGRAIDKNNLLYLGTISRSTGILMGAGFAMLWRPLAVMRGPLRHKGRALDGVALLGLAGLIFIMAQFELVGATSGKYYAPLFWGGFLLTDVFTIAMIAGVTHRATWTSRILGINVLNWIGTRSYGLYLYHWPIYQMIRKQAGIPLTVPKFVVAIAITLVVAELSYRYVEMPIRRREFLSRLRGGQPRLLLALGLAAALVGYAGVSLATADVKCTNKIECDSEAAHAASADAAVSTSSVPAVDQSVSTVPGETTTTLAPTTTPPKQVISALAIGESVMQGAEGRLLDNGFVVDADESRGYHGTMDALRWYRDNYDVSGPIVIQLGTNGEISQEEYEAVVDEVADEPLVVMLTVKAEKDWIAGNNERIRALPATHPNVKIVDWEQRAQEIAGDLSPGDGGVHLYNAHAMNFYTNLILEAVGKPAIPDA
jgi:peptidoglycan/LPS O-acetylase OafA/YrhL